MKMRIVSILLASVLLFSGIGELTISAQAVEDEPVVQEQTSTDIQSISIRPSHLWMQAGEQTQLTISILSEGSE